MAIETRKIIDKQPFDKFPVDIQFSPKNKINYNLGEITDSEASAIKWHKDNISATSDATSEILQSNIPTILSPNNTSIRLWVKDGTNNYDYKITISVTFDTGAKLQDEIYIRVREK